jgi:TolB-like protein/Flp pilus assembly protein TadD
MGNLFQELKRRQVLPVAGGYVVVAWVLIQVADVVVPALALPEAVMTAVLIIAIVGFPVAIALAWIFDITADGIKRTLSEWQHDGIESPPESETIDHKPQSATPKGSIAVLPFTNIGGDEENEYFSDGLTEDIIDALAKVPDLQVVARTSAFVFKNKYEDIRDIGSRLNVEFVVEGSVRKAGNRMRIVSQLIKVKDGYHVWSETFDRNLVDVFDTLDEITDSIANHLKELLSDDFGAIEMPRKHLVKRHTDNLDAYHLYLKGRYYWNMRGDGIIKGMEYFQQAAAADSSYALPYVGLADTFALLGYYGYQTPRAAFPLAKENATKALSIDPTLAEAHTSRALVKMYFDWDWKGAREEFMKAIELRDKYAPAHYWFSVLCTILQDPKNALEHDKLALEVDPVSPFVNMHHGWTLHCARRYEEAIAQYIKTLELDHRLWPAYQLMTYSYAQLGRYEDAIAAGETIREGTDNSVLPLPSMGFAYAKSGQDRKARAVIAELESREAEFVWPSHIASIYGVLGDFDRAFEWLEKAYSIRDHWLITMNAQPEFESLHQSDRYNEFATRVGIGDHAVRPTETDVFN